MHRFFFATKDAFINSGSDFISGVDLQDKNTGQDEILELKKYFDNRELQGFTRVLLQFDTDEIKTYITASNVPGDYKLYLRLWETKGTSGLSETYTIAANALTQSWDEGVGKESDTPKTTEGVSWKYRQNNLNAKEVSWRDQYPDGISGDPTSIASASIDLSNWPGGYLTTLTQSIFAIKNSSPTYPEVSINNFHLASSIRNPDSSRFYLGNGIYMIGGSGSVDHVGSYLRDVINLFKLDDSPFNSTLVKRLTSRTVTSPHHDELQYDGGAILPYSASWDGTNLHLTASRIGIAYNDIVISTGSIMWTRETGLTYDTSSDTPFKGGFGQVLAGAGGNYARTPQSTQSFSLQSPDIEMDITDIAKKWFGGSIPNNGLLLRISGSSDYTGTGNYELDSGSFEDLKFFSKQTNTIYSPKLELRWDDHLPATGSNTGSLTTLDLSGEAENYLYPLHFREAYKEPETVKFRFGARKRYINKSFTTSVQSVSGSYIAEGSGSYSIIDLATNESVVPFSSYTSMSCDSVSPYFKQDLNGFEPNRAYKILIKVNHNDDQTIIYDDDFEFILRS